MTVVKDEHGSLYLMACEENTAVIVPMKSDGFSTMPIEEVNRKFTPALEENIYHDSSVYREVICAEKISWESVTAELRSGTQSFHVGDIYKILLSDGTCVPFEVVRIRHKNKKVYFMAKNVLTKLPMNEIEDWLSEFEKKLPAELRELMVEMQHINKFGVHVRKVMLPSLNNLNCTCMDSKRCTGTDDVHFSKFISEASRCKDFKGETCWYWTDTSNSPYDFWIVHPSGGISHSYNADDTYGVCPCFAIQQKQELIVKNTSYLSDPMPTKLTGGSIEKCFI